MASVAGERKLAIATGEGAVKSKTSSWCVVDGPPGTNTKRKLTTRRNERRRSAVETTAATAVEMAIVVAMFVSCGRWERGKEGGRAGGERARAFGVDDVWGALFRCAPRGVVVRAAHLELNDVPAPIADGGKQRRLRRAKRHPAHANAAIHGRSRKRAREMCGCAAPPRPQGPPAWIAPNTTTTTSHVLISMKLQVMGSEESGLRELATPHNNRRGYDELPRKIPQEARASSGGARWALGASAAALTRGWCVRKTSA